ncbi:NAD(P)H-binding protein [Paenibacillus sp. NPDC057886]
MRIHQRIFSKAIKDKAIAERAVQRSDLDWVIVRPAWPPL